MQKVHIKIWENHLFNENNFIFLFSNSKIKNLVTLYYHLPSPQYIILRGWYGYFIINYRVRIWQSAVLCNKSVINRCFYGSFIPLYSVGSENVVLLPCKRTRFGVQKDSFYRAKGLHLEGKRTTFQSATLTNWLILSTRYSGRLSKSSSLRILSVESRTDNWGVYCLR